MRSREALDNDDLASGAAKLKESYNKPSPVAGEELQGFTIHAPSQPTGLRPDRNAAFRLLSQMQEYHETFKRRWANSSAVPPYPRRPFYAPEASYAKWYRSLTPQQRSIERAKYVTEDESQPGQTRRLTEDELLGVQR